MFYMFVLLSGTEVRPVLGVEEEVDGGYLETNTNLVSEVSTLSPFSFSCHHSCHSGPTCHVPNSPFKLSTAYLKRKMALSVFSGADLPVK